MYDDVNLADMIKLERDTLTINVCALFIGLVGNSVVCIVILCSKSLYTLTDFYLLSLSITDLLTLITKTLLGYYYYHCLTIMEQVYLETGLDSESYVFHNKAAHYANHWLSSTALYASVFTVTAFTIERYLAICRPFVAQSMSKTSRVKTIIATIWSIGVLVATMQLTMDLVVGAMSDKMFASVLIKAERIAGLLCLVMPNLAIVVMYILIARGLKRCSIERPTTLQTNRSNGKALKMFAIIIVTSFLSWIPYSTQILLETWPPDSDEWTEFYLHVNRVTNITYTLPSVLNPIIYTIMSSKFRAALKDLFSKARKKMGSRTAAVTSVQTDETEMS